MGVDWWLPGLTVVVSTAVCGLLVRFMPWLINDREHLVAVRGSRLSHPFVLLPCGILLGAAAATLFPALRAQESNGWDIVLLAVCLGSTAAATPLLFLVDVLVRRLPDRVVLPLIGISLTAFILGLLLGESRIWVGAIVSASVAAAFFGTLVLVGRVIRASTMGLGDVKLAFVVGGIAGLHSIWALPVVFVIMVLVAGVVALVAAVRTRRIAGVVIAFGPAMLSGMWFGSILAPFLL